MAETLQQFRRDLGLSMQGLARTMYRNNAERFKVQKEAVAVRNLSNILDATLALANRKGFAAMSLRDLSERSGLSLGGLYAYIGSKDDLVALIQAFGIDTTQRILREQTQGISDPRARLQHAIRGHLFLSEILRAWFYFSYMEARHLSPEEKRRAVAAEHDTELLFRGLIEEGQKAGVFRHCDARMAAALLKPLLQDWYLKRSKYRSREISVERYAESVIELMENHLLKVDNT
ncbi:MAG: TetR/AcrR family transcriptional regulator [Salinisphaeraceae bacterium]|nr:TetR/AcrR family transcriptional regulator [Salinisphaeraceae bacterium]